VTKTKVLDERAAPSVEPISDQELDHAIGTAGAMQTPGPGQNGHHPLLTRTEQRRTWRRGCQARRYHLAMLGGAPLMAFVPVRDLAAARAFYGDTLGLPVTDENPFAVVLDAGGTMLRLTEVGDLQPQPFTIAGWQVPDIDAAVDTLVGRGVTFTRYEGMDHQDERGIWTTPGGDRVVWFKDPDGNTLSLTSFAT